METIVHDQMWEGGALEERNKWLRAMGEKEVEIFEPVFNHEVYVGKILGISIPDKKIPIYGIEHPDGTGFVEGPTPNLNELLNSCYYRKGYKICIFTETEPEPLYVSNSKGEWIEVIER